MSDRKPVTETTVATRKTAIDRGLRSLRTFGPYLLIELLLPGGSLVAGLAYLLRNKKYLPTNLNGD